MGDFELKITKKLSILFKYLVGHSVKALLSYKLYVVFTFYILILWNLLLRCCFLSVCDYAWIKKFVQKKNPRTPTRWEVHVSTLFSNFRIWCLRADPSRNDRLSNKTFWELYDFILLWKAAPTNERILLLLLQVLGEARTLGTGHLGHSLVY